MNIKWFYFTTEGIIPSVIPEKTTFVGDFDVNIFF